MKGPLTHSELTKIVSEYYENFFTEISILITEKERLEFIHKKAFDIIFKEDGCLCTNQGVWYFDDNVFSRRDYKFYLLDNTEIELKKKGAFIGVL